MRTVPVLLVSILSLTLLSACKTRAVGCKQDNRDYVGAKEMPPLKAPPGLDPPNTRNALRIPPLETPERNRGREEACLDAPPPFANPRGPDAPATN